jgi:hypothetical protein
MNNGRTIFPNRRADPRLLGREILLLLADFAGIFLLLTAGFRFFGIVSSIIRTRFRFR